LGVEYFPSYSPDGSFVVYSRYVRGGVDIFLQRIGGDPINLTPDSPEFDYAPAFSPDGQWIVFRSERQGGGIYVMGSTGESVRRVSDFGYNPAWTPDGRHIIVATEAVVNPVGRISKSELWSIDVSTGNKKIIHPGDAVQPAVSPNQHRIAFWGLPDGSGVRDIFTIPIGGGEAVAVTSDAFVDWNPVWSRDGRYLYFASDRGGTMNIWRVSVDERTGKTVGGLEALTAPASWTGHLNLSHDGTRMIYVAQNEISTVQRVRWDAQTSALEETPQAVVQKNAFYVDCSPDGERLVLSTSGAQEALFVISTDGTERRQLTDDIHKDRGPSWSPDGTKIYFYSNRTGRYEIWSIAADGSDLRQVTTSTGLTVFEPHVLPDGKSLIVNTSNRGACRVDLTSGQSAEPVPLVRKDSLAGNFRVAAVRSDGQKLCGNFQRADGGVIEGIVTYDVATQRCERLTDFGIAHAWLKGLDQLLYIASDKIFLFDLTTRDVRFVLKSPPNGFITSITTSPQNDILYYVTTTVDSDIWQATLGK
jgi:Tol biopolymer transport system component